MPPTTERASKAIPHLDPATFVGQPYDKTKAEIESQGWTCKTALTERRISWRYAKDYDPLTMNFVVHKNIITAAWIG